MTAWAPSAADYQQLSAAGRPTGGSDCTAWSTAAVIAASTGGRQRPTGREVRLATDEPVPDPASPGLNIGQVQAAARRWGVELDARRPWAAAALQAGIESGRWAVVQLWRGVLVDAGAASGFRAGHAVAAGPGPTVIDPLVPRPLACPWPLLWRAAAALPWGAGTVGAGRALAALGPVPPPADRWRVRIAHGARVRIASVSGGVITGWPREELWSSGASAAPCEPPALLRGRHAGSATVARVTAGKYAGLWLQVRPGVVAERY